MIENMNRSKVETESGVPEKWRRAMLATGDADMLNPNNGEPSMNGLARAAGVSAMTVRRLFAGDYSRLGPDPDVIHKVAKALNKKPSLIAKWAGINGTVSDKQYVLPPEAAYLTAAQQKLVDQMIRGLTEHARQTVSSVEDYETMVSRRPSRIS